MHFPTHRGNERCSFLLGENVSNDIIANSTQVNDFSKLRFVKLYETEELLMLLLLFPSLQKCKFRFERSFGWLFHLGVYVLIYAFLMFFKRAQTSLRDGPSALSSPPVFPPKSVRSVTRWRQLSRKKPRCSRSWMSSANSSRRSSRSSASPSGSLTSAISPTRFTAARGSEVPSTTLRLPWPWQWLLSRRVFQLSSPPAWRWAPVAWPRKMPLFVLCPQWRRWDAPLLSAQTRRGP